MTVNNSLFVIAPYWDSGTWVFDDERVGLVREPFVSGVPDMIDHLVRDMPEAREIQSQGKLPVKHIGVIRPAMPLVATNFLFYCKIPPPRLSNS